VAVTGNWTLFYDWDCDGSYGKTTMTVNANGTLTIGEGSSGRWVQVAGMFMFNFNNDASVTYAGNLASKSIVGISTTTLNGLGRSNGCFYMLQAGVPTTFAAEGVAGKLNAQGK
jgi:hypothetical protein